MKSFKVILNNERGVAFMMVILAIVVLTALMANFSYDTNINKVKSYNIQDRAQARLNAETALNFSMARLRLYQETYNLLQENKNLKGFINQEIINILWQFPFAYPVPITKDTGIVERELIENFEKESFIEGEIFVTIQNISQKFNLNLLRLDSFLKDQQNNENEEEDEEDSEFDIYNQLKKTFEIILEEKRDTDKAFYKAHSMRDIEMAIESLKAYVSDKSHDGYISTLDDSHGYSISSKEAPMNQWSELYMLPYWTDDLVNTIQNEYGVSGETFIDLNNITPIILKLLIPQISDDEIKEIYEYKDNPDEPIYFNSIDEFKSFVVNKANILTSIEFEHRINKFEKAGIRFGVAPTMFRIVATGIKGRAKYTIRALVTLPFKPIIKKKNTNNNSNENNEDESPNSDENGESDDNDEDEEEDNNTGDEKEDEEKPQLLLTPRILEIFID